MRTSHDAANHWREQGGRVAVFVVVACCHLGLLLSLLRGDGRPWYEPYPKSVERQDALQIRFFNTTAPRRISTPPGRPRARPTPRHHHHAAATVRTTATKISVVREWPQTPPRNEPAKRTAEPGYIAGGNLLRGSRMNRIPDMHLPGSEAVIVPGIHLVDSRTQGMAGVARVVQALLGVADTQCVNVDHWRTLSIQEMLAQHISPEQVQETADAHHCRPKP